MPYIVRTVEKYQYTGLVALSLFAWSVCLVHTGFVYVKRSVVDTTLRYSFVLSSSYRGMINLERESFDCRGKMLANLYL